MNNNPNIVTVDPEEDKKEYEKLFKSLNKFTHVQLVEMYMGTPSKSQLIHMLLDDITYADKQKILQGVGL